MKLIESARGPKLPLKLQVLAKPGRRISDLARKFGLNRQHVNSVIVGKYNSARVDSILKNEWGISVEEARSIYKEHKERIALGNPVTAREAFEWKTKVSFRQATQSGKTTKTWEEYLAVMDQISWPTFQYSFTQRGVAA